jgi:hypothetical protein
LWWGTVSNALLKSKITRSTCFFISNDFMMSCMVIMSWRSQECPLRNPCCNIKAFPTQRHQRVVVEGEFSSACTVDSGVPQGTVLGPLLFLYFLPVPKYDYLKNNDEYMDPYFGV